MDTKVYLKYGGNTMQRKYSDEFKLAVIKDYYNSTLGVRAMALKYNLPSKNYINNWEKQLKKKGYLPSDATKPNKSVGRSKESIAREDTRTPREMQYEAENQILKAKVAYYESLESLQPFLKKNSKSEK
jgi:transposase-like protein